MDRTCSMHRRESLQVIGWEGRKKVARRPGHRWEDNIQIDLREIGIGGVNWMCLTQDRLWWWSL